RQRVGQVPQPVHQVDRLGEVGVGLGGQSEDEVALDADAAFGQAAHHRPDHGGGDAFVDVGEDAFAARFDAERDLAQAVVGELVQGGVGKPVQDVDASGCVPHGPRPDAGGGE